MANSNWHSIHDPVTIDMLTGVVKVSKDVLLNNENDIYYNSNRNSKRENSHTIRLRKFHNFVKEMLIRYVSSKKKKIQHSLTWRLEKLAIFTNG